MDIVKMVRNRLREKRTLILFLSDVYLLTGVVLFGWNPARMIGFCFLDVCICLLSYIIYNFLSKYTREVVVVFMATALIYFVFYFVLLGIASACNQMNTGHSSPDLNQFFYPYYDVAIFLFGSASVHSLNVRKYLSFPVKIARPGFSIFIGLMIFMVPFLFIVNAALSAFLPLKLSLIISLVSIRHYIEYRRYKSFKEIEKEASLLLTAKE